MFSNLPVMAPTCTIHHSAGPACVWPNVLFGLKGPDLFLPVVLAGMHLLEIGQWRHRALVRERPAEVSLRRVPLFDGPDEPIPTFHAVCPIGIAELRGMQTPPQDGDGGVMR